MHRSTDSWQEESNCERGSIARIERTYASVRWFSSKPISVNFFPRRVDMVRASSDSLRAYTSSSSALFRAELATSWLT